MFDVSVAQTSGRHTSTVDVDSPCRCLSSTKNKKQTVPSLSVQGMFTEKFPFLHTSNVSPKNGNHTKRTNGNMYTPVNSLHNDVEDNNTEGRRQTVSGETQETNHGTSQWEVTLVNVQVRVSSDTEGSTNLSDVYAITHVVQKTSMTRCFVTENVDTRIQKDGYKSFQ